MQPSLLSRKPIALGSLSTLVLSIALIAIPALAQGIFSIYAVAMRTNIDLLFYSNMMNNMVWINAIPPIIGGILLCFVASRFIRAHYKVDASKTKRQFIHLSSWVLIASIVIGFFAFLSIPTSQAMNTATTSYILDTPVSDFDYLIGNYSDSTSVAQHIYAINGSNWDNLVSGVGSTSWSSYTANYTKIEELALSALSTKGGIVLCKNVAFNLALMSSIPVNVTVVCKYGSQEYAYINPTSTAGSPYTVSVGQGLNGGYYTAEDCQNRIAFTSSNASYVINSVKADNTTIHCKAGSYGLSAMLDFRGLTNFAFLCEKGAYFYETVSITDLVYVGGAGELKSTHITIQGAEFSGSEFGTNTNNGIIVGYAEDITIRDCYCHNFSRYALGVLRTAAGLANAVYLPTDVHIYDSMFEGCPAQTTMETVLIGGIGNSIENSVIRYGGASGITVYDNTFNRSSSITVRGCNITDNHGEGITVNTPCTIENNNIKNNGNTGIYVFPNGEQITDNGGVANPIPNVHINKNIIWHNGYGVEIKDSREDYITENDIRYNNYAGVAIIEGTLFGVNAPFPIEFIDVQRNTIANNGALGTKDGVFFSQSGTSVIQNCTVAFNKILNEAGELPVTSYSIRFDTGSTLTSRFDFNNCFGSYSKAGAATITGCTFFGNNGIADATI